MPFSSPSPETFMVRVLGPDGGQAGGLGALVGARHVVTCAHVVNVALGLGQLAQGKPDAVMRVDFPLLGGGGLADGGTGGQPRLVEARIAVWRPPPREGAAGDDFAGLVLDGDLPDGAVAARLAVEAARAGHQVRVFGYPGMPARPDGVWVATTVRGAVGNGRLQLDSGPDSALRVRPGFSGSPVCDDRTGRIIGMLAAAPVGGAAERDSYAISAGQLRLAWPEVLAGRWQRASGLARRRDDGELTVLHVSDIRFGCARPSGEGDAAARGAPSGASAQRAGMSGWTPAELAEQPLFGRLHRDLAGLAVDHELRPDLIVVTGNLAEQGRPSEFRQAVAFLAALAEAAEVPRRHVAVVPGNHDISRRASAAYFLEAEAREEDPVAPYWPKWEQFAAAFGEFYEGVPTVTFTPDEPWTLFEMPDLAVAVAGLNSTMADNHRRGDHYGLVGEQQLGWFAGQLANYRRRGWLRLAAVHHDVVPAPGQDDAVGSGDAEHRAQLRDVGDLDRILGQPGLTNLLLHGHGPEAQLRRLPSGLVALSAGRTGVGLLACSQRPAVLGCLQDVAHRD